MIVAKLKNPLTFTFQESPTKTVDKLIDSFYILPDSYVLGGREQRFFVHFTKESDSPLNPSSEVIGEGLTTKTFHTVKIFSETLNYEELSTWGTDDTSLFYVFANKYGVEIDQIVEVVSPV